MESANRLRKIRKEQWCVIIIMFLAIVSRAAGLGSFPGGVNVDEAYAGYEAWAMAHYGMDSWGFQHPVYLTVWGSGMSVLNSVLMMPFVRFFGLNTVTIRLPQMIVGILSVYVFYLLLKKITNRDTALWGMFLFAICPWHIMMSRWGLDCNLAPGFLMFAVWFFVKGLEKDKYLMLSALSWGLSLYCYATVWILVPVLLLVWGIYCLRHKKIAFSKSLLTACVILILLALPLLLFVAVNMGWIPEIRSRLLSVPRLVDFRSDELGKRNLLNHIKALFGLFIRQDDGLLWNTTPYFGMYYLFSLPFILCGFILYVRAAWEHFRKKEFGYEFLILVWIFVSAITGILQGINVNKINYIHIPVIILWTEGVSFLCAKGKRYFGKAVFVVYALSFLCFEGYYFTEYQEEISRRQQAGADQAVEAALSLREERKAETIVVPNTLRHSQILFYTEWSLKDYMESVRWQEYPARWLKTESFGCFEWIREEETENFEPERDKIYLVTEEELGRFEKEGWCVEMYGYAGVAYSIDGK